MRTIVVGIAILLLAGCGAAHSQSSSGQPPRVRIRMHRATPEQLRRLVGLSVGEAEALARKWGFRTFQVVGPNNINPGVFLINGLTLYVNEDGRVTKAQ